MKRFLLISQLALFVSCDSKLSTEEIAKQVKLSISESLKENPLTSESVIKDFTLVHKGGNLYEGILDVEIKNDLFDEEVIDDSEV